jgi:hypothetical protein
MNHEHCVVFVKYEDNLQDPPASPLAKDQELVVTYLLGKGWLGLPNH